MGNKIKKIKANWHRVRTSARFHNVLMFLIFVAIAALFWFIIALNDSIIETFRVQIHIQNVPDSVTFINDPPAEIHVTVRDKGTNILRSGVIKNPTLELNFRDYARDGIFRLSHTDLNNELKSDLGGAAQITAASLDSIRLYYTDSPGKIVPVIVQSDVTAASGYIIAGQPVPLAKTVKIFSYRDETDTVHKVLTQKLVQKDLSQTSDFSVKLRPIANVKIVPSQIKVKVNVEPLVHKEVYMPIEIDNLPQNMSLLLFPNRVAVSLYVPMSRFNDENYPIHVTVDFNDVHALTGGSLPLKVKSNSADLVNVTLKTDSVDYTLVKH